MFRKDLFKMEGMEVWLYAGGKEPTEREKKRNERMRRGNGQMIFLNRVGPSVQRKVMALEGQAAYTW